MLPRSTGWETSNETFLILHGTRFFALSAPVFGQFNARFNIGGGATLPVYNTGQRHDNGWNAAAGLTLDFEKHFGIRLEGQFHRVDITDSTLNALQVPDGETRMWSVTLNPVIRFNPDSRVVFYLIGGGGIYNRTTEFTAPTVTSFLGYDPYFNYYYEVGVPTSTVLFSQSNYKAGVNGGGGIEIPFSSGGRAAFYMEARYHRMYTRPFVTSMLPVTIGLRF